MIIEYTRHARRRMKWRKISEAEIKLATYSPDDLEPSEKTRINAYKKFKDKILKVTYQKHDDRIQIITALWKGE
jgi:hypothetical protein